MKLRQKLVALLATSMIITSVPVITMADSINTISVYNYNIKNTTIGFKSSFNTETTTSGLYTGVKGDSGFNYKGLPGIEISPKANYVLNSPQTAFVSITDGSSFQTEAYLYFIDAVATTEGISNMYFKDGKVWGAANSSWNGKTKEEVLADNATYTIYFDQDGKIVSSAATNGAEVTITVMKMSETIKNERKYTSGLRLDFKGNFDRNVTYKVPFLVKVGGDKEVLVDVDGKDSFVSSKTYTLTGVLSDKKIVATSSSKKITADNIEEIGEIRIDENAIGALSEAGNQWIKVKLPSSTDLQFNLSKTENNIKATGKRGFYGELAQKSDIEVEYGKVSRNSSENDEQVLLIKLPSWMDESAKGQIVLTGIYVEPQDRTASTGDVNVTVSEDFTRGNTNSTHTSVDLIESTTLKVAEVLDYGVSLTATPVDVKAGRSGVVNNTEVTFSLKEAVKDSLVDSRKIEFKLENGYIFGAADVESEDDTYTTAQYKELAKQHFQTLIDEKTIEFKADAEAKSGNKGFELTNVEVDSEGHVIGFTGYFDRLSATKADEIKITMPVAAPVQATGEIKLTVDNLFTRTYDKEVECVVGNIIAPIEVEIEKAAIKVGLQDQTAGKVVIKETDKGMIERGWMFLAAEELQEGLTFDEVPTIEVTSKDGGALKIENVQLSKDKKVVAFEVTRTSKEASAIEISDIRFTADRTVPEASYDLQIWGDAITDENILDVFTGANQNVLVGTSHRAQYTDCYKVEDFISITTKNTQDITAEGLRAATATFVIGENSFTVNDEVVEMDMAAYIKNDYTMVPVKFVAKAFGIEGNAVQYDKATSTATIIAGNKVIAITANKDVIIVNGTAIPMGTKAEVKEGRMCVPMTYIAAALNVQKSWDSATKTATFTNQER